MEGVMGPIGERAELNADDSSPKVHRLFIQTFPWSMKEMPSFQEKNRWITLQPSLSMSTDIPRPDFRKHRTHHPRMISSLRISEFPILQLDSVMILFNTLIAFASWKRTTVYPGSKSHCSNIFRSFDVLT